MACSRPPPSKSLDLDLTIVSAKHLKNVNWKNGSLKPYVVFWVDPDRRLATKSDDSGSTKPIWNERFTLPLPHPLHDTFLNLEIFHSQSSDTSKPLVASLHLPLRDIHDLTDPTRIRKFPLNRPSGRPHGEIYLKLGLLGRPIQTLDHVSPSPSVIGYAQPTLPPHNPNAPPSLRDYRGFSPSISHLPSYPSYSSYSSYPDAYPSSGYYPGYYSGAPPPPTPSRPFLDRPLGYASGPSGPSAPIDYSSYEKPRSAKVGMGIGAGLAVGAVAGAVGGLALEEGVNYEEEKIAERVESAANLAAARDDYSEYRVDY